MRRHLREALGGDDGCEGDHGVVAKMEKKTGDYGAGAGAHKRENDTDESEKRHQTPGPAKLSAVHQAKEDPGDQNTGEDAKRLGEERIEIAAENGFFDERRDKYRHGHKQHGAGAALEKFLDGDVVHVLDARAGDGHEDGQATAGKKIHPGAALAAKSVGVQSFPTQGSPEGHIAEYGKRHIKKKKDESEPQNIGADDEPWIGLKQLFELLLRKVAVRRKVRDQHNADRQLADYAKYHKDQKMQPRPGDAQIFGERRVCLGGRGDSGVGDGVAGERSSERFRRRCFRRMVGRTLRVEILVRRIQRIIIEEGHRFPGRDFLGQPEASAAATSGKSSSWWPVMA